MSGKAREGEAGLRLPPHDLEAERAVLGSMMLDAECIAGVRREVGARDFYGRDNRAIFEAICALADDGGGADLVTLVAALRERGDLERVGGADYVAKVLEAVPSAARWGDYAGIVASLARRRRVADAARRLVDLAHDPMAEPERLRRLAGALGRAFEDDGHGQADGRGLLWRPASEIELRELRWCWPGRFPLGGVSILVGPAGEGKSTLTCDLTARLSAGRPWPDGSPTERGRVGLLNAEDPADRITIPRLMAARADLKNVQIVEGVEAGTAESESVRDLFDLRRDAGLLEGLAGPDLRAVILDPASAFLPGIDDNSNTSVRSGLARLAGLAERLDVAVVLVHHFRKARDGNALAKVAGSLAFGALARAVWGLVRDPQNPSRRLLLPVKANWTAEAVGGLAFTIESDPTTGAALCAWEAGRVDVDINDLLAPPAPQDPEVRDEARWLRDLLREGPVPATDVPGEAERAGLDPSLLDKAKAAAGVESRRVGFGPAGHWEWYLPGQR